MASTTRKFKHGTINIEAEVFGDLPNSSFEDALDEILGRAITAFEDSVPKLNTMLGQLASGGVQTTEYGTSTSMKLNGLAVEVVWIVQVNKGSDALVWIDEAAESSVTAARRQLRLSLQSYRFDPHKGSSIGVDPRWLHGHESEVFARTREFHDAMRNVAGTGVDLRDIRLVPPTFEGGENLLHSLSRDNPLLPGMDPEPPRAKDDPDAREEASASPCVDGRPARDYPHHANFWRTFGDE